MKRALFCWVLATFCLLGLGLVNAEDLTLTFPDLPHERHDQVAQCHVTLPKGYDLQKKYPLVVWLEGGDGGDQPHSDFLPPGDYVLAGLPYPKGANHPTVNYIVGDFPTIWKFHRTMLEEIYRKVPNIDRSTSIIAGFSNGAHSIDGMLRLNLPPEERVSAYFRVFILVEGGGWTSGDFPGMKGKFAYVAFGENSGLTRTVPRVAQGLIAQGAQVRLSMMRNTGHSFADFEKETVKHWLAEEVFPKLHEGEKKPASDVAR